MTCLQGGGYAYGRQRQTVRTYKKGVYYGQKINTTEHRSSCRFCFQRFRARFLRGGGGDSPSNPAVIDPRKPAGGNGGEDTPIDKDKFIALFGGTVPEKSGGEIVEEIAERMKAPEESADITAEIFLSTDWYWTTRAAGSSELMTFKSVSTCREATCTSRLPDDDDEEEFSVEDVAKAFTENRDKVKTLQTKRGITMARLRVGESKGGEGFWGAVLGHSSFGLYEDIGALEDEDIASFFFGGVASGDLYGKRPTADVEWTGLMVGAPTAGEDRGNILRGDATVNYSSSDTSISVSFTDIAKVEKSLDDNKKTPHSVTSISFPGVEVTPSGAFGEKSGSEYIQGGLYGPGNEEVAGVFEKQGIAGAFGANK